MEAVEHYVEKFQPEHYRLFLDINRREKRFSGTVSIKGLAVSQDISLHQKGLEISSVMVAGQALDYRLDEYQAFFEAELTNLALQRDIAMGIKSIAARIQMVEINKEAVEKALADY